MNPICALFMAICFYDLFAFHSPHILGENEDQFAHQAVCFENSIFQPVSGTESIERF